MENFVVMINQFSYIKIKAERWHWLQAYLYMHAQMQDSHDTISLDEFQFQCSLN